MLFTIPNICTRRPIFPSPFRDAFFARFCRNGLHLQRSRCIMNDALIIITFITVYARRYIMLILIKLSVALIGGLMTSRIAKKMNLPAVTAYLVAGLLLGPFFIGSLGIGGVGFSSLEDVGSFSIISNTALGFIAFTIGNEFRIEQIKKMGSKAIVIGILQAVITTALVDAALVGLHFIRPDIITVSSAITLGAIAAATAPAATLMVVRQYKADGPMTKLLLLVVAIDDAVGLVLFSASFGIAKVLESGNINMATVILEPIIEVIGSILLGAVIGFGLHLIEKFFHSRSKRLSISIAFVLLTIGVSMAEFEIAGIHIGFSLLLVAMMCGTVFCNVCDFSEELMGRVDGWTAPLFVLFFVLSGAELDLAILADPLVLLIGAFYIVFRSAGKYFGAYASCAMTDCSPTIRRNLGITLLPQAGVALGMALTAQELADGGTVRCVILFSVLVYELVGPALTKRSLIAAGEITPEGKTSARVKNSPVSTIFHIGRK